jgi:quercetin dioxygenase-like cupin family protein
MSVEHAKSGETIRLLLGPALGNSKTTTLVKTADLEVLRLILPAGKEIPTHQAPGEITIHCLEGRVELTAEGKTHELAPGQMVYLAAGAPHAVKGIQNSSLLVTLLLGKAKHS